MNKPTGHPYYDRNSFPPYKLRRTWWWVVPLLPVLGVAWVVTKVSR